LLGHCRALEVVAPGGREFLDRGKAGVNWDYETRGRKSISATISITLADIHLKMLIYMALIAGLGGERRMKLQFEWSRSILLRRARHTASTLIWNDPEPTLAYQ
jgi:hypothetical protein